MVIKVEHQLSFQQETIFVDQKHIFYIDTTTS